MIARGATNGSMRDQHLATRTATCYHWVALVDLLIRRPGQPACVSVIVHLPRRLARSVRDLPQICRAVLLSRLLSDRSLDERHSLCPRHRVRHGQSGHLTAFFADQTWTIGNRPNLVSPTTAGVEDEQ
jgi:hypothetical protein